MSHSKFHESFHTTQYVERSLAYFDKKSSIQRSEDVYKNTSLRLIAVLIIIYIIWQYIYETRPGVSKYQQFKTDLHVLM